jgi:hypothetical protein
MRFQKAQGLPKVVRTPIGKDRTMSPLYGDVTEYNRLMDAAKARAHQLRSEAVADFWNDAGHGAQRAWRSAKRYARSLARHALTDPPSL